MIDRQLVCGEIHYPRIAREQWCHRLQMAYAMGLDAISTYVFWNAHEPEPGRYDFSGQLDVASFVREAANCGLDVVLRPGPYVCAEWDFGGLPAWLLAREPIALRTTDEAFMTPVRRWLRRLGKELAPLQRTHGGPIVVVQLENEYGAFGGDPAYLQALRDALDDAGFGDSPYCTIDQPRDLSRGSLPGVAVAATFGPGEPETQLRAVTDLRPGQRKICGEYWAGWFDHWGEPHARRDDAQQVRDVEWMLREDCSFNFYMWCGGTNFGFSNGANLSESEPYAPVTTSYDYLAALDEAGRPRPKYFAFREAIARARGLAARPVPPAPQTIAIPAFELAECAPLSNLLYHPVVRERPETMEALGQAFGFILYRTTLQGANAGPLEIAGVRDYATVFVDGAFCGTLDRRTGAATIALPSHRRGATLDVLVENCGRVNYGPSIASERKGIAGQVRFAGEELLGWQMFLLPMNDLSALRFDENSHAPAFWRGHFLLDRPGATFFDASALGKGVLFVNGHNAGRFWSIGPQRCLYVPESWLVTGVNEAVAFDVTQPRRPILSGSIDPK